MNFTGWSPSQPDPYSGGPYQRPTNLSNMYTNPQMGDMAPMMTSMFSPAMSRPLGYSGAGSMGQTQYKPQTNPGAMRPWSTPGGPGGYPGVSPYEYDPMTGGPRPSNRGPSDWNAVPKPGVPDPNWTPNGPPRNLSMNRWSSYGAPSYYQNGNPYGNQGYYLGGMP